MRKLKYIKLFEAFDSRVLSKTLGYIDDESKKIFLSSIKNICAIIDFPMSELSDEYFEYLPFKAALNKNVTSEDKPCTAKSVDLFDRRFGIEGEICHGGRIKRKWGERNREVACPACNGTGIKPKKSNVELLKFWFNVDGKYITTTCVDGVIRPNFSKHVRGEVVDFYNLEHGEKYLIKLQHRDVDFTEGTIYMQDNGVYFIQNTHNGSTPYGDAWRQYGRFSWCITGNTSHEKPIYSAGTENITREEAYSWNVGVAIDNYKIVSTNRNIQSSVRDANFAIILDYEALKNKEFQKRSTTKAGRQEIKKHSLLDPDQTSEKIKKKNIERYLDSIVKKSDITSNIANCNKVISRILTYSSSLYIIRYTDIGSDLQVVLRKYIEILDPNTDDDIKKSYILDINDKIVNLSKRNMNLSGQVQINIKAVKDLLLKNKPQNYKLYIKMLNKIDEISLVITKRIKEYDVETIDDFEIVFQKINITKNIIRSDRYRMVNFFDYLPTYICQGYIDRAYQFLVNQHYFDTSRVEYDLERIRLLLTKI